MTPAQRREPPAGDAAPGRAARHRLRCTSAAAPTSPARRTSLGLLALAPRRAGPVGSPVLGRARTGGVDAARALGALGAAGDLFADGALGSHTACLHEPYVDASRHTVTGYLSVRQIARACRAVHPGRTAGRLPRDRRRRARGGAGRDRPPPPKRWARPRSGRPGTGWSTLECSIPEQIGGHARPSSAWWPACSRPSTPCWGGEHGMYADRLGPAARRWRPTRSPAWPRPACRSRSAPTRRSTPLAPWGGVQAAVLPPPAEPGVGPRPRSPRTLRGGWAAAHRPGGTLSPGVPAYLAIWDTAEFPTWRHRRPGHPAACARSRVDGRSGSWSDGVQFSAGEGTGTQPWVDTVLDAVREEVGLEHGVTLPVWPALGTGEYADLSELAAKTAAGRCAARCPRARTPTGPPAPPAAPSRVDEATAELVRVGTRSREVEFTARVLCRATPERSASAATRCPSRPWSSEPGVRWSFPDG